MSHIITEPCVNCKDTACVDVCPVDCIYDQGKDQLFIQPEECIDCELCVDVCPVEAAFSLEEVPTEWTSYIAKNYTAFGLQAP